MLILNMDANLLYGNMKRHFAQYVQEQSFSHYHSSNLAISVQENNKKPKQSIRTVKMTFLH